MRKTLEERFWARVDRSGDDCWDWQGSRDRRGYGVIILTQNGKPKLLRAHRVSWELTHGPIPAGVSICHRCDRPSCVRVDHLFAGSHADNMADMARKGRAGKSPRPGETNPAHHLTAEQAAEIRRRYHAGGVTQEALAAEYGVSQSTVGRLVTGACWSGSPLGDEHCVKIGTGRYAGDQRSRPRRNGTGYKGVLRVASTGRFVAYIVVENRKRHLGMFGTAEEAAQAYNAAAKERFGADAWMNPVSSCPSTPSSS